MVSVTVVRQSSPSLGLCLQDLVSSFGSLSRLLVIYIFLGINRRSICPTPTIPVDFFLELDPVLYKCVRVDQLFSFTQVRRGL